MIEFVNMQFLLHVFWSYVIKYKNLILLYHSLE